MSVQPFRRFLTRRDHIPIIGNSGQAVDADCRRALRVRRLNLSKLMRDWRLSKDLCDSVRKPRSKHKYWSIGVIGRFNGCANLV